ncbi:unnamed protein product, partial [Amoebophrya sp. A25]
MDSGGGFAAGVAVEAALGRKDSLVTSTGSCVSIPCSSPASSRSFKKSEQPTLLNASHIVGNHDMSLGECGEHDWSARTKTSGSPTVLTLTRESLTKEVQQLLEVSKAFSFEYQRESVAPEVRLFLPNTVESPEYEDLAKTRKEELLESWRASSGSEAAISNILSAQMGHLNTEQRNSLRWGYLE